MPKITGLGAGSAPANTDVLVLVSNTAGTANTQKVTVNTFFSDVTANAKFANAEITLANVVNGVVNASSVTATTVQGTTTDIGVDVSTWMVSAAYDLSLIHI